MKCRHTKNNNKYNQDQQFEQIRVGSSLDMEILKTTTKQKLVTDEVRWENCTLNRFVGKHQKHPTAAKVDQN